MRCHDAVPCRAPPTHPYAPHAALSHVMRCAPRPCPCGAARCRLHARVVGEERDGGDKEGRGGSAAGERRRREGVVTARVGGGGATLHFLSMLSCSAPSRAWGMEEEGTM